MFDDLKQAIKDVLNEAKGWEQYGIDERTMLSYLKTLQAEYNIHFVEPDAPQLDII